MMISVKKEYTFIHFADQSAQKNVPVDKLCP